MKGYPAYKDSGVDWIGEIPDHWSIVPIKHSTKVNRAALPENTEPDFSFRYIDIGNVNHNGLTNLPKEMSFGKAPSRARRIVKKGDTIVSTVRTYLKAIHFIRNNNNDLIVSTGFATLSPTNKLNPKFLYYAVSNQKVIDTICRFSVGVSYPAINSSELGSIPTWFPEDIQEQQFITGYLDHKTRLIDTLIEKKQKQMELLQEQRAAIINQAVTKGLNPNVKMKDSGIEWLGEVPENWEVKRFKHLLRRQKGAIKTGPFGSQLKGNDFVEAGIKVYNQRTVLDYDFNAGEHFISEEKYEALKAFKAFPGDILVTTRGTIGRCAIVPEGARIGVLHPCLIRLQVDTKYISNDYLSWFIQDSENFKESVIFESNATTIEVIYGETLKNVRIPLPPIGEQEKILTFLNQKTSMMDSVSKKIQQEINALQEYRTTLISEVVTGKIDVRNEVIP